MTAATALTVVGDARLAEEVGRLLPWGVAVVERLDEVTARAALVAVRRVADTGAGIAVHEAADRLDARVLPVLYEHDGALVGPWIGPAPHPCMLCLGRRRARARPDAAARQRVHERLARGNAWPLLTHSGFRQVLGAVVARHVESLEPAAAGESPADEAETVRVAATDLHVTRHRWIRDPLCARCGCVPADSAAAAALPVRRRPKCSPQAWRQERLGDRAGALLARFVDRECGLVRALRQDIEPAVPVVGATLGLGEFVEHASGQGLTYDEARLGALAEALERYGSASLRSRRPAVRASYAQLGARAVHPPALGLPDEAAYRLGGVRRYTDDAVCDWVWGHSMTRDVPVLVPAAMVAYADALEAGGSAEPPFARESSNGWALGGSPEEALLHALFEVSERDAFLLTWYAQLPSPEIALDTHPDPTVRGLASRIEGRTGARVRAFDITVDLLPAVWAVGLDEDASHDRPALLCAAGSHADPQVALRGALLELGAGLETLRRTFRPAYAARMIGRPDLVLGLDDHAQLYGNAATSQRLRFLLDPEVAPAPRRARSPGFDPAPDVADDLRSALDVFSGAGLDVVAVDQTPQELAVAGFACVKALVPGTVPMTFGHAQRRVRGIRRLLEIPAVLGAAPRPLRQEELNPHPHPFP